MGLDVGGYDKVTDFPKLGPSLLIATCMILAIRTARWPAIHGERLSNVDLQQEIDFAVSLAGRVMSTLLARKTDIFPQRQQPRHQPNDEDTPK